MTKEKQLQELTEEELKDVAGGMTIDPAHEECIYKHHFGGVCPRDYMTKGDKCCRDDRKRKRPFRP